MSVSFPSSPYRLGALMLTALHLQACGGGSGSETDASPSETEGPGSESDAAPSETDAAGSETDAAGSETDASPASTCGALRAELPVRTNVISVEAAGDGQVLANGEQTTLRAVIQGAASGTTIELLPGTYELPEASSGEYTGLYFTNPDVTLRGASGNAADVIVDSAYHDQGEQTAAISVDAPGIVLADFTVQRSIFHLVHLWANGDDAVIFNVRLVDGGQQFLKASPGDGTVDDVEVSCSAFVMTDEGRDNVWGYGDQEGSTTCYTGGIDTHDARNWTVRYSHFEGIYCDTAGGRPAHGKKASDRGDQSYAGGLAEHAIHMWNSEQGSSHQIYGNSIVDCARGIGIGLVDPVYGTRVTNNSVFSSFPASREHDVGIIVEHGTDIDVSHNTVFFSHPDAYPQAIEIRFDDTRAVSVENNLTNRAIRERDGALAEQANNVSDADPSWFVEPDAGDLHLLDCDAVPSAERLDRVELDIDGQERAAQTPLGADECAGL